jgi:hypothetical protein
MGGQEAAMQIEAEVHSVIQAIGAPASNGNVVRPRA